MKYRPPRLDAPPIYTTGPNPHIAEFVKAAPTSASVIRSELPRQIVARKTSPAYRAHSYHTKVPPEGIVPFIERYTAAGAVVLDPFCGSGMTGVAALKTGRRAVLLDLSPAATFIAANYCIPTDPRLLRQEAERVLEAVEDELAPLYTTRCRTCGGDARIALTVWSERYHCPCGNDFALWDVARKGRRVAGEARCPRCGRSGRRGQWDTLEPAPVLVRYDCQAGCGRGEEKPDSRDIETARRAAEGWDSRAPYPRTAIPTRGDEIARVHKRGISRVDQLFTRRNLRAIATLWQAVETTRGLRCRRQLFFCLTGAMPRASRTNKFIPALGLAPGPILGTMYIPGLHPEVNVLALFRRKVRDAARYYEWLGENHDPERSVRVSTQSATDLGNIPSGSIDYVFTDPPFGANIAYSELNLLWEAWLGRRIEATDEAVVSRTQGKTIADYRDLMAAAFREVRRVLRPEGRFSVVFHNASGEVWRALQDALDAAGFGVESVVVFDKGPNQSFKQFTTDGAVTHDLVVTCVGDSGRRLRRDATEAEVAEFLCALDERARADGPRRLYSAAVAHFLTEGLRVPVGFKEFRRLLKETPLDD